MVCKHLIKINISIQVANQKNLQHIMPKETIERHSFIVIFFCFPPCVQSCHRNNWNICKLGCICLSPWAKPRTFHPSFHNHPTCKHVFSPASSYLSMLLWHKFILSVWTEICKPPAIIWETDECVDKCVPQYFAKCLQILDLIFGILELLNFTI
jgi:hypothetical protein